MSSDVLSESGEVNHEEQPGYDYDVVVAGSGAAGLSAAAAAAELGMKVIVLEAADVLGGTTAISGGRIWIPNNHLEAGAGILDRPDMARNYLQAESDERWPEMVDAFVETAPQVTRWLESITQRELYLCETYSDYHTDTPGALPGGRVLDGVPFEIGPDSDLPNRIRRVPGYVPITKGEWEAQKNGDYASEVSEARRRNGTEVGGRALVAALAQACNRFGVELRVRSRVVSLTRTDGRVAGATVEGPDGEYFLSASRGVVLATGGFERNAALREKYLPPKLIGLAANKHALGDALGLSSQVGASHANLDKVWWMPMVSIPSEADDGVEMWRAMVNERGLPGSIFVNRHGKRFMNECVSYNDQGKILADPDNSPCFMVFDEAYHRRYSIFGLDRHQPVPDWVLRGATIELLAKELGINGEQLASTISRFNADAERGVDSEYGRGDTAKDRYYGDEEVAPNPCLAALSEPPYYAIEVVAGTIGTKGGVVTDTYARVLDELGKPIRGLWACGNAAAFWAGDGYAGPGHPLALGITFGFAAGRDASEKNH